MTEQVQYELAGMPERVETNTRPERVELCTYANYKASCEQRWGGWALRDALENWEDFEEHRTTFEEWTEFYRRDAQLTVGVKALNPTGTLSAMVGVMQVAIQPDRSCLYPCLDFEEHFQTVFIRRGLLIYLTLLLKEKEK